MLEPKIAERARGLIHPTIQRRRALLADEIQRVFARNSAKRIGLSGNTAYDISNLLKGELRERSKIVRESFQSVLNALGVQATNTLATELKREIGKYRKEDTLELAGLLTRNLSEFLRSPQLALLPELSLAETESNLEAEISGKVDLFVDALQSHSQTSVDRERAPLIFISCGQFTEAEREVGTSLEKFVNTKLPPCEGYFAQNQNSLDGLSRNIFGALYRASGFVAVMHDRGKVNTLSGSHMRASIWIEQELAIAAFIAQAIQRPLPVEAYIQRGIKREGVREQLHLNQVEFDVATDILRDFESKVGEGKFKPVL